MRVQAGYVALTLLMLVSVSPRANADEAAARATVTAYADCASLATAAAFQQRDVLHDQDTFGAMAKIGGMYQVAAMEAAKDFTQQPKEYVIEVMRRQLPGYVSQLKTAQAKPAEVFKAQTARCAQLEPQVSQIIQNMQSEGR